MILRSIAHRLQIPLLVFGLGIAAAAGAAPFFLADDAAARAKVLLMDHKYRDAAELLAKDPGTGDDAATRRFLRGHALLMAGDASAAGEVFESYNKDFPQGADAERAKFALAAARRAQKNFGAAAAVDRDQLRSLLSPKRRLELAKVYLDYADKAEKGAQPDWKRSRTFLDLAVTLELDAAEDESVRARAALMSEKLGELPDALQRIRGVKSAHGDGKDGATRFRIAELERLTGDVRGARRTYQDFLRDFPKSDDAPKAAYGIALTYGMPAPADAESLARGVAALKNVMAQYPKSALERDAAFDIAQAEMHLGRLDDAVRDFAAFVSSTPQDQSAKDGRVAISRARIGDALAAQSKFAEAIDAWQLYLREHPTHGEFARVHRSIVDAEYAIAAKAVGEAIASADKAKDLGDKARAAVLAFLAAHPLDARQARAALDLGRIEEARERYDVAREEFEKHASKYAQTAEASEAQFHVGRLYEEKTFDFEKALAAYGKVQGPWADRARSRVEALRKKTLAIETKRTFRTDEEPSIEITSRNLDKVRVRVFKLDLEAFFRAKLNQPAIESLDVEVIEPDAKRDVPTSPYVAYQQTTRTLALPECKSKQGAFVVKVDGGELEAATLVLVSDLVIVTKASKRDALVFAQHARTGEPMPGVRVVGSDGTKILFEANTGADGVLLQRDEAFAKAGQLYLYGSCASGAAVSGLDLRRLNASAALSARGLAMSDRSSYAPGETVRAWAVLRALRGGNYAIEEGRKVRVALRDAAGAEIQSADGALSPFGSVRAELAIPAGAPLGTYSIAVTDAAGGEVLASRAVEVEEVRRERIRLAVELERSVLLRGEPAKGTVRASYFSGGPVAKRGVTILLTEDEPLRLTTNERGEATFTLETRDLGEEGSYAVAARLDEENVFGSASLEVATVEFRPAVSVLQPVVLAGESFDATVVTSNMAKKPIGAELKLSVLAIEPRGTRSVDQKNVVTDKETGKAVVRLAIEKGGRYLLRVEGADRFGTAVVGETSVEVSGDDDAQKLRFFTERSFWNIGETLKARVVSRLGGERSVLLTAEGGGVLGYRIAKIAKGETTLEWPLDESLAPHAVLAMAAVDDWKLYQASKRIAVSKDLRIAVKVPEKKPEPGARAVLDVTVRDARGNPAAAEVLLSAVDAAFLAMRPDNNMNMRDFFFGGSRDADTVTGASCGFLYRPSTRRVASDLAAEEARVRMRAVMPVGGGDAGGIFSIAPQTPAPAEAGRPMMKSASGSGGGGGGNAPELSELASALDDLSDRDAKGADKLEVRRGAWAGKRPGAAPGAPLSLAGKAKNRLLREAEKKDSAGKMIESERNAGVAGFLGGEVDDHNEAWGESNSALSDPVRREFGATAAFLPVVTGADGAAKLEIQLPETSTEWSVTARGVSKATELGAGNATFAVRRDLETSLRLPGAFVEGDRVDGAALVRNPGAAKLTVEAKLEAAGASGGGTASLELNPGEEAAVGLPLTIGSDPKVSLTFSAKGGDAADGVQREVGVRAAGSYYSAADAALVRDAAKLRVGLAHFAALRRPSMWIRVSPPIETEVMEDATMRAMDSRPSFIFPDSLGWTISRGMIALERLKFLGGVGGSDDAAVALQRRRIAEAVSRLLVEQNPDGSFAWAGVKSSALSATPDHRGQSSDVATTARAIEFLARAKAQAFAVPPEATAKGVAWLKGRMRGDDAPIDRARIALALAEAGELDAELANRLQRGKADLPDAAVALLALADVRLGRRDLAAEVADELRRRAKRDGATAVFESKSGVGSDAVEATALAALAFCSIAPGDALIEPAMARVRAAHHGGLGDRAESAVIAALATYTAVTKPAAAAFELTIQLNGEALKTIKSAELRGPLEIAVDAAKIRQENVIDLALQGRGEVSVEASMSAIGAKFETDPRKQFVWIQRVVEPAVLTFRGKPIRRGYSVVDGPYTQFQNEVKQLALGTEAIVSTSFSAQERERDVMDYAVLEEPIPAGCEIVPGSITGNFERVVVRDGAIVAAFPARQYYGSIQYKLLGVRSGEYVQAPSRVRSLYRADRFAEAGDRKLSVLKSGVASADEVRLTPDELYHLGTARFDAGEKKEGAELLRRAVKEWRLRDEPMREASRRILMEAMERGDSAEAVAAFERLRDRFPEVVLPFETVARVGESYISAAQPELADLLFRGTMGALFRREANVAGALLKEGEFTAAVDFLERLHRVYPDLPEMLSALHQLAGLVSSAATGGDVKNADGRPVAKEQLLIRAGLIELDFLARAPEDPAAPEAAFGFLSTELDRGIYANVVEGCAAFALRYPQSPMLDQVMALEGYARFANGDPKGAITVLDRVATEQFPDGRGGKHASSQKDRAVFLKAQILHATGESRAAVAEYEKVQASFTDAADAIAAFRRRSLELPQSIAASGAAPIELHVKSRNLAKAMLRAYRVDLMRLYLMERNLDRTTAIDLAGIAPTLEKEVALGAVDDFADRETTVPLELPQKGAYLIVMRSTGDAKAEPLAASALALRTDLKMEVREDAASGRVWVSVFDAKGAGVPKADIRIVGSRDGGVRVGATDLRGVFIAEGIHGRCTVVAQTAGTDSSFAYYRGTLDLVPEASKEQQQAGAEGKPGQTLDFEASNTAEFRKLNSSVQMNNGRALQEQLFRAQDGVDLQRVK